MAVPAAKRVLQWGLGESGGGRGGVGGWGRVEKRGERERREEWMVMELGEGEKRKEKGVSVAVEGGVGEEGETYAHWMHTTATCFLSLNTTL